MKTTHESVLSIILFACGVLTSSTLAAKDIYVAQVSRGAGSGIDCVNTYSVAFFNSSANWGIGSQQIGPGTTVHLCGTISTNLTVQGSGSSDSPITIYFEPGANLTQIAGGPFITISDRSNVIVDGGSDGVIQNTGAGTNAAKTQSKGILAMNCNNCEVRNLRIENLYVHSGSDNEMSDITNINCIRFSGNNISIHNNIMHDAGWCIFSIGAAVGNRIYNNDIYNIDHAIAITPGSNSSPAGPTYIYNNRIHDYANWDTANNAYHHDGIHCYSVPTPYPQPVGPPAQGALWKALWIYNNLFDGQSGGNITSHIFLEPGVQTNGYATPCMDKASEINIFGNVFIGGSDNTGTVSGGANTTMTGRVTFYNNTVLGSGASRGRGVALENIGTIGDIRNNLLGGANQLWSGVTASQPDYNGYVNCASSTSYNCWPAAGPQWFTNNFNVWRSFCGCDSHSVNSQESFGQVDYLSGALSTGSPMIGAGLNLTAAVSSWPAEQRSALAVDRNGRPRGNGAWDVGALVATATVIGPLPASNLKATVR